MNSQTLLDTGPLVAFLNKRDTFHSWATSVLDSLAPPLISCESVISEACFLVRKLKNGQEAIMELLLNDLITLESPLHEGKESVAKLLKKYHDVPISLADACLVALSEKYPGARVLTLDSDFRIYRKKNRQVIPLIYPED